MATHRIAWFLLPLVTVVLCDHDNKVVQMSQDPPPDGQPVDQAPGLILSASGNNTSSDWTPSSSSNNVAPDWFLSSSGNNTVDCGHSSRTACKTLDWILARFHTTSYRTNRTLVLYTDINVIINKDILNKFPWVKQLEVETSMINITQDRVQVTFYDVTVLNTTWVLHGLNLLVYNADLSLAKLILDGSDLTPDGNSGVASVFNSTFGTGKVTENYKVKVKKCSMTGSARSEETILEVNKAFVDIDSSQFNGNQGGFSAAIVKASYSSITVNGSSFTGNMGHNGLFHIGNGSDLVVNNSNFHNNGFVFFDLSTILVDSRSSAVVMNTVFLGNIAAFGGGICSMVNTYILVENCTFLNNSGQYGSSINCNDQKSYDSLSLANASEDRTIWELLQTQKTPTNMKPIKNNSEINSPRISSSVPGQSGCVVIGSTFNFNEAYLNGGAIYVQGRAAQITNSSFHYNIGGGSGGGVSIYQNSEVNITSSQFENNQAVFGNVASAMESVRLFMDNCKVFAAPSKYVTGYTIYGSNESKIEITNSNISNAQWMPGIVDLANFTEAIFENCTLESPGNRMMHAVNNINITFKRCFLKKRCEIEAYDNTKVTIIDSSFDCPVFYGTLIQLHYGSHLFMSGTNLSGMNSKMSGRALVADTGSTATFVDCSYSNNNIWTHIRLSQATLTLKNVNFINNTGNYIRYGAKFIQSTLSEIAVIGCTFQDNLNPVWLEFDSSFMFGLADSNLNITDSSFLKNRPDFLLVFESFNRPISSQYIQVINSTFDNYGASWQIRKLGDLNIQDSNITFNWQEEYNHYYIKTQGSKMVRISNSHFKSFSSHPQQIYFQQEGIMEESMNLETLNSSFSKGNETIASNSPDFLNNMTSSEMFQVDFNLELREKETFFASVSPVECTSPSRYPCFCHYFLKYIANVYNCSNSPLAEVPETLPADSDWLILKNNQITQLIGTPRYLANISSLDLQGNKISSISLPFITEMNQGRKLKWLNLAHNQLTDLPLEMQYLSFLEKVWLSDNSFHCDCSMTWMIGWLNNFTTPTGQHVIEDYKLVKCHSGLSVGKPIYLLNDVEMGCFPSRWTLKQKLLVSIGAGIALIIILTLFVLVVKNYREVKFFLWKYMNWIGVARPDTNEDIGNMKYDALLLYSGKDTKWVNGVFRRNRWKRGSKLFDLERIHGFILYVPSRELLGGGITGEHIEEAMETSRRIIIIVSRNFLASKKRWKFTTADQFAQKKGSRNKVIVVFKDKIENMPNLPNELRTYQKLKLCVGPMDDKEELARKIRFNMPRQPLSELRKDDFPKVGDEEVAFDESDENTDTPEAEEPTAAPQQRERNHDNNDRGYRSNGGDHDNEGACGFTPATADSVINASESDLLLADQAIVDIH